MKTYEVVLTTGEKHQVNAETLDLYGGNGVILYASTKGSEVVAMFPCVQSVKAVPEKPKATGEE